MTKQQKPRHLLVWSDFHEWKPALEGMFSDILTRELGDKVRQHSPPVKYRDDSQGFKQLSGQSPDEVVTKDKIDEFRGLYSHIRVFHACRPRPADIRSYYEKGLLPSRECRYDQMRRLRQIFPDLTDELLQEAIAETGPRDQDLCLVIDSQTLVKRDSQYLISHGGEYLMAVVGKLRIGEQEKDHCLARLRQVGTPTVFEVNLPSEYASEDDLCELICDMIMNWMYYAVYPQRVSDPFDFTFSIAKPLPGEHISGYFHPETVKRMRIDD